MKKNQKPAMPARFSHLVRVLGELSAVIAVMVIVSVAVILLLTPPAEYLPEGEEPKTFASMSAPPGYNIETMKEIGLEVQDYFMQFVDDDPDRFDRSESDVPAIRYLNTRISADGFRIISEPVRPADIDELMDAITEKYRQYPGMRAFAARGSIISSNDGGTRSINLDVSGPNLGVIYEAALATYRRAEDVFGNPRIQTRPSSLSLSQPMLEVQPDWARAAEFGLTASDVGYTVAALTDGAFVDEYFESDDKIDMYLYGTTGGQADVDSLGGLRTTHLYAARQHPATGCNRNNSRDCRH